ncbi:MAG: pyrroline-5-carboxylate reductase [Eubacteriaceae bacterium]|nr:pyrroline-5-carboxylate reductase [Eubacteriaceae bacterium]
MPQKIGFIGSGNMAEAIFSALIKANAVHEEDIAVTDVSESRLNEISSTYKVECIQNSKEDNGGAVRLAQMSDVIIMAVKPQHCLPILKALSPLGNGKLVISIMGGIATSFLEEALSNARVVRAMPNTPMLVLEGCCGLAKGKYATQQDFEYAYSLFSKIGIAVSIDESLMDSLTAISGCGPAFAYMFIESLANAGVLLGISFEESLKLAAQTLLGASKMVLQTGKHPAMLKDEVSSPAGSTIAGVLSLENDAFRASVINAAKASMQRMAEVGRQAGES